MIKIESSSGVGIVGSVAGIPYAQKVDIIADTEAEILALGEVVTAGELSVRPTPGSMAHTAGYKAIYELSPSGMWVKV